MFPELEDPQEEGMATHSDVLAWRIPRTEKPGGLQSVGSQRVSLLTNNWMYSLCFQVKIHDEKNPNGIKQREDR